MKICFIAPKAYPVFNYNTSLAKKYIFGGGEIQLSLISKELAKEKDTNVSFVVGNYHQKNIETVDGVKLYNGYFFEKNLFARAFLLYKTLNKVNADIYIQRALDFGSGLISIYCILRRKRFVYMVAHDDEVSGEFKKNHSFLYNYVAFLVFKLASNIIVQNTFQKTHVYKKLKRKSILLNTMYPLDANFKKNGRFILWVGRSAEWKRPELFIDLAKRFQDYEFIMICPPAKDYKDYHAKLKRLTNKMKNLEFIDYVSFNKIEKYFKNAKIYVNTSTSEGFPNTFVQAAKNRTPIVSLQVNPNDFLQKYNCGYYCSNDMGLLKNNIEKLMKNENLYNKISANSFNYAKKNHDIKNNIKKLLNIVRNDEP